MPTKGHLMQLDKVYIIGKFNVRVSNTNYVPFAKRFMIEFTSFTTVTPLQDPPSTFPAYIYNITPFSNIDPFGEAAKKFIGNYMYTVSCVRAATLLLDYYYITCPYYYPC